MAEYFQNPDDLRQWVRSRGSYGKAAEELIGIISDEEVPKEESDIIETCKTIFENDDVTDDYASQVLFGVLAKHNLTLTKEAGTMKKEAQESRQRNKWVRGRRNKWNRTVEGFNENTPWRLDRDKMYDKTHYYTDAVTFDENPNHVYSGEAIWRMYVMDKFYRDYKDEDGRVVGGYLNDRFQTWHDVAGNQMELADGERTRKPRPHQYSTERRLEEARGEKTEDILAFAKSAPMVKIASTLVKEREDDQVYQIFRDVLDMREAEISYKEILTSVAEHYGTTILKVAEIDRVAKGLSNKHNGIIYTSEGLEKTASTLIEILDQGIEGVNLTIESPNGAQAISENGQTFVLSAGSTITKVPNTDLFEIVQDPVMGLTGNRVTFADFNIDVSPTAPIQDAANELGLNEEEVETLRDAAEKGASLNEQSEGFEVTEVNQ